MQQQKLSIYALLPIFITHITPVSVTWIMYKLRAVRLLNLPCVCVCVSVVAGVYVFVNIKRLMNASHLKTYNSRGMSSLVCTDLSDEEPHRQVGLDRVMTSGSLAGIMISTLARTQEIRFDSCSRCNISHF